MKKVDALKDILQSRIVNQMSYNEGLINNYNPELRQVYTQLRDDEMRSIVKLQQRVERLESARGIVSKLFNTRLK